MGLFTKKNPEPRPIGQALVMLDDDGWAYVNQQHHPNMDPDIIAMLAPITFVIVEASRLWHRGPEHVSQWLITAGHQAEADPDAVNRHHNPAGVVPLQATGAGTPGSTGSWGSFTITPASRLTGTWSNLDGYASDLHRARILAALIAGAHWRDAAQALPGAIETLRHPDVRYDHPATSTDLPQIALDHGIQQAALASLHRARPWEDGNLGPTS